MISTPRPATRRRSLGNTSNMSKSRSNQDIEKQQVESTGSSDSISISGSPQDSNDVVMPAFSTGQQIHTQAAEAEIGGGGGGGGGKEASKDDEHDPNLVDWDSPDDPEMPMNWPRSKRVFHVVLISAITFTLNLAATLFAPSASLYAASFSITSPTIITLLISIYILGFATGPLIVAPLSELYGRLPIYHVCNASFLAFTLGCGASNSLGSFLACRFLSGCAGAAPVTIGGGTIADLMPVEKRGKAMAGFTMGPLLGPVFGPIVGGFIGQHLGWRWTFWIVAILSGFISLLCVLFMRETYAPILLSRKTSRLIKSTGNTSLRAKGSNTIQPRKLFLLAILRPSKLLLFSPVVLSLSLYIAFILGLIYLGLTTFPMVFESVYDFTPSTSGLAYLGQGIGSLVSALVFSSVSDKVVRGRVEARRRKRLGEGGAVARDGDGDGGGEGQRERGERIIGEGKEGENGNNNDDSRPEDRMTLVPYFTALVPVGFFWYGWAAEAKVHWIVPILGTTWIGLGCMWVSMATQTYLVDAYGSAAGASALAAFTVVRCSFGAFLPLAGPALYEKLGYGWGNSVLAFIAVAFLPLPVVFLRYGEKLRTRFVVKL